MLEGDGRPSEALARARSRTPAPPPFSGMKTTPAASSAARMAFKLLVIGAVAPRS